MPSLNPGHLLQHARQGDDEALGQLIEGFRPLLRAEVAGKLIGVQRRVDASDVIQQTWWSAFRDFPKFEGDVDAFVGWLRNIHDRNLKDAVRDQPAEKRDIGKEVSAPAALPLAPAKISSPSHRLVRAEEQQYLRDCVSALPPAQKEAVQMRYFEGLPIAEICARLGRPETAVAGLLKRGLSGLRELMDSARDRG